MTVYSEYIQDTYTNFSQTLVLLQDSGSADLSHRESCKKNKDLVLRVSSLFFTTLGAFSGLLLLKSAFEFSAIAIGVATLSIAVGAVSSSVFKQDKEKAQVLKNLTACSAVIVFSSSLTKLISVLSYAVLFHDSLCISYRLNKLVLHKEKPPKSATQRVEEGKGKLTALFSSLSKSVGEVASLYEIKCSKKLISNFYYASEHSLLRSACSQVFSCTELLSSRLNP